MNKTYDKLDCAVDRIHKYGYCKAPRGAVVYGSMVHMREEQIISDGSGSGTVFLSVAIWVAFSVRITKSARNLTVQF